MQNSLPKKTVNSLLLSIPFWFSILTYYPLFSQGFSGINLATPLRNGGLDWGDYDNDGDLDLVMCGSNSQNLPYTIIYRNDNGLFVNAGIALPSCGSGDVSWGDYDQDNNLDLIITGSSGTTLYHNNGNGTFTANTSVFATTNGGTAEWGDYDQDGDSDILLTASSGGTWIYQNDKGVFTATVQINTETHTARGYQGDYDNDGDLDILELSDVLGSQAVVIYQQNQYVFAPLANTGLPALSNAYGTWVDLNNDGYLDIVIDGIPPTSDIDSLYFFQSNRNGTFTEMRGTRTAGYDWNGSMSAMDYDADGFQDIVISGIRNNEYGFSIYKNSGMNSFQLISSGPGADHGEIMWGDYNSDHHPDFALTGMNGAASSQLRAIVYNQSTTGTANTAPTTPYNLYTQISGSTVTMGWICANACDQQTPLATITYNVWLQNATTGEYIVSPSADYNTGKRKVACAGNAGARNTFTVKNLNSGIYTWGVQAIDGAFEGSGFSTQEGEFTVNVDDSTFVIAPIDRKRTICGDVPVQLKVFPEGAAYQWKRDGENATGNSTDRIYSATAPGTYSVQVKNSENNWITGFNTITVGATINPYPPIAPSPQNVCSGVQSYVVAEPGLGGTMCLWYSSELSTTPFYTGNALCIIPGQVATTYYVSSSFESTGCESKTRTAIVIQPQPQPAPPTINGPITTCQTGLFHLQAQSVENTNQVGWFSSPTSELPYYTGTQLDTVLNASTTFYVRSISPTHCISVPVTLSVNIVDPPGLPVVANVIMCAPGQALITALPVNGSTCRWYPDEDSDSLLATTRNFQTPFLSGDYTFYVTSYNETENCEGPRHPVTVTVNSIVAAPLAEDVTRYGSSVVPLYAAPPAGANTCKWYSDSLRRNLVFTGLNFLTPRISTTTTYWIVGVNTNTGCSGTAMKRVRAIITTAPDINPNPDYVFNIPQNKGNRNYNGVNLFTGDLNLTVPLAAIGGELIQYQVALSYNSRSVALSPLSTSNEVNGLGWKLNDYPKMAYDVVSDAFWLLMPDQKYKLDTVSSTSTSMELSAGEDFVTWKFVCLNSNQNVNGRQWQVTTGDGTQYVMHDVPVNITEGGSTSQVWNISTIRDSQLRDSLTFSYNGRRLISISTINDERLTLLYNNQNKLLEVRKYSVYNSTEQRIQAGCVLTYATNIFPLNTSYSILQSIQSKTNCNPTTNGGITYVPAAPPSSFEYSPAVNAGAMSLRKEETGSATSFVYGLVPSSSGKNYYPVVQLNNLNGTTHKYETQILKDHTAITIEYDQFNASADGGYYAQFNEVKVLPGVDELSTVFKKSNTSFEDKNNEPLFENIRSDWFSTDYALSGTQSVKFDYYNQGMPGLNNREIITKQLFLNKALRMRAAAGVDAATKYKGPQDSVAVGFYAYDKHQSLEVKFKVEIIYYDSLNKILSHEKTTLYLDEDNYGKWVPFELHYAVPQDAHSFRFEIWGGDPLSYYDFYLDNFWVSGADYERQGAAVYHFFNGNPANSLKHLPDEYLQTHAQEKILSSKFTSFETGDPYTEWISHGSDCKPKQTANTSSVVSSYNGTNAYRMRACDSGNKSSLHGTINTPSGADYALLTFHYSSPQISGMSFRIRTKADNASSYTDTIITLTNSYFVDSAYRFIQRKISIGSHTNNVYFEVKVMDSGNQAQVNDFFIDDLSLIYIQYDNEGNVSAPVANVTNPLIIGKSYHIRVLSDDHQELQANEYVYAAAVATNGGAYMQLTNMLPANRGAQMAGNTTTYNSRGQVKKMKSAWTRTLADSSHITVFNEVDYLYAYQLWPALTKDSLHRMNDIAMTVNYTKNGEDSDWDAVGGNITQWKKFTNLSTANGGKTSQWAPWRTFTLIAPVSAADLQTVIQNISSSSYTPPASAWRLDQTIMTIDGMAHVIEAHTHDSITVHHQLSHHSFTDVTNYTLHRSTVVTADFVNATADNSFYNGFEPYETQILTNTFYYSTLYANTGERCAFTSTPFTFNFKQTAHQRKDYQIGVYLQPVNSTVRILVKNASTGTTIVSQLFSFSSAELNQWNYVEMVFPVSDSAFTLSFTIDNGNGGQAAFFDDFRFCPRDANFTCKIYDIPTNRQTAALDNNSQVHRNHVNYASVLIGSSGANDQPEAFVNAYWSGLDAANQYAYSSAAPNAKTQFTARGAGLVYNWGNLAHTNQWTRSGSGVVYSPARAYLSTSTTMTLHTANMPTNLSDWGVSLQTQLVANSSGAGTQDFTLDFGNCGVRLHYSAYSLIVQTKSGTSWTNTATLNYTYSNNRYPVNKLDVYFAGTRMLVWVDGQLINNTVNTTTDSVTQIALNFSSGSLFSKADVRNLTIMNDPLIELTYLDGALNTIQQQTVSGNDLVVSEIIYDVMQRDEITTKPAKLTNTAPGYQAGFVTSFDWSSGQIKGTVTNAANYIANGSDDENFVYTRTVYHKEPAVTPSFQFNAGKDFALRDKTGWEKAKAWMYGDFPTYLNDAITVAGYVFDAVDIVTNPETAPLIIAMDAGGLLLSFIPFSNDNTVSEKPITSVLYDAQKNVQTINLPMANRKKHAQSSQKINYTYDFMNHVVQQQFPESGTTHYSYDKWDNPRFAQTEDDKTAARVQYFKYDRYNRLIESGYMANVLWTQSFFDTKANIPGYPTGSPSVVTNRNYYDGNEGDSTGYAIKRDHLTQRTTISADNTTSVEQFWYDSQNNIVGVKTTITNSSHESSTYSVSYVYDKVGNIISTIYPAQGSTAFVINQTFDKLNKCVTVGTPANATEYATYSWNPDGSLQRTTMHCVSTTKTVNTGYAYNAPGWNTAINQTYTNGSHTSNIMQNNYNYNFVDDVWGKLWGESYYNGNEAQRKLYHNNKANVYRENDKGFVYDSLGRVNLSYNEEAGVPFYDGGSKDHPWSDDFDLNGNLIQHACIYYNQTYGADTSMRAYTYGQTHNRLQKIRNYNYHASRESPPAVSYDSDTLYATSSNGGFYTSLKYNSHAPVLANYGHPVYGRIDSTSTRTMTYDQNGMLYSANWSGTNQTSGSMKVYYDGQQDRLRKTVTAGNLTTTTTYIRGNNSSPLVEIVESGGTTTYNYYVQGSDGVLALVRNTGDVSSSWLVLKDHQGSTQALVNRSTGIVDLQLFYDDYGVVLGRMGTIDYSYLYTGQEYDKEIQLYNYRSRLYDPWMRMFLSPDPQHQNYGAPYSYALNNPVNYIDPDGEWSFIDDEILKASAADVRFAEQHFAKITSIEGMLRIQKDYTTDVDKKLWRIEMRRRLNSRNPAVIAEIRGFRTSGPNGTRSQSWKQLKYVLRPGGMHEMFNVANVDYWLERGLLVDDILRVTHPTGDSPFKEIATGQIGGHHRTSIGKHAHMDFDKIIPTLQPVNLADPFDVARGRYNTYTAADSWARGTFRGQEYTFAPSSALLYQQTIEASYLNFYVNPVDPNITRTQMNINHILNTP
jgi:RHS repeat-associated protein